MELPRHDLDRRSPCAGVLALSLSYVECDVPDDATLREWRRSRAAGRPARPRLWRRVVPRRT
jgi:hypothetical protein